MKKTQTLCSFGKRSGCRTKDEMQDTDATEERLGTQRQRMARRRGRVHRGVQSHRALNQLSEQKCNITRMLYKRNKMRVVWGLVQGPQDWLVTPVVHVAMYAQGPCDMLPVCTDGTTR